MASVIRGSDDFDSVGYLAQSTSSSGYIKMFGGLIIQWGKTGYLGTSSTQSVTFPISFPNACLTVTNGIEATGTNPSYGWTQSSPSTTGITFYSRNGVPASGALYIAIGY